ncbi:MAG TPA: hypothetical protein VH280_01835 [Verrucomicrobiae bacterium]|jgi:hypothetical protein|nr:hypothetical protein [Verrucomicrobiae bacterium]
MKCLTTQESENWLSSINVHIDGTNNLLLSKRPGELMSTMPKRADNLIYFSARLTDLLPGDSSRIIWLSDWNNFPFQVIPFEKIRAGCGESRPIFDAQGHLFESATEEENGILAGLIFLIMAFNWSAYVVVRESADYVYLGDEYIIFSSSNGKQTEEASKLMKDFKLELITDVKDAWK